MSLSEFIDGWNSLGTGIPFGLVVSEKSSLNQIKSHNCIRIRGARLHNLKHVDVDIPRDRFVAVTGVSGSGKSTLIFDTLFAEGQRRFLESLSLKSRQYLQQWTRPAVDLIDGLPPPICVEQNPGVMRRRSTLASITEILDYLQLLYAKIGQPHCPECGRSLARTSPQGIMGRLLALGERRKLVLLAPLRLTPELSWIQQCEQMQKSGYLRVRLDGEVRDLADIDFATTAAPKSLEVVIDRIILKPDIGDRLKTSLDLALKIGAGACIVSDVTEQPPQDHHFQTRLYCSDCDYTFSDLQPRLFNFNSPSGACPTCSGLGTVAEDRAAAKADHKHATRITCPQCQGKRLCTDALAVTVAGLSLPDWTAQTVPEAIARTEEFRAALLNDQSTTATEHRLVADSTLPAILSRMRCLEQIGLEYLSLDRSAASLSGGEYQRARLVSCLGSGLLGVCYLLDEPTGGLHPRDTQRLVDLLRDLQRKGNSVIVVEHDVDLIRQADHVLELGPGAGRAGGRLTAAGTPLSLADSPSSVTAPFLRGGSEVDIHASGISSDKEDWLELSGITRHNLRQLAVRVPLGALVCITGVSGSGKSTLVAETLVPAVRRHLAQADEQIGWIKSLTGADSLARIRSIDQRPIGRSARSTPATYAKIWNEIRKLFARTRQARLRGYSPARFSFNSAEGCCPTCKGTGKKQLPMKFLAPLSIICPECQGNRFNRQTLSVRYRSHSVADVLRLTFAEAVTLFENISPLREPLQSFVDVGLGYLTLGQSAQTLSGGEAQRVKLARELIEPRHQTTLFVLDEPTTGLHPCDVQVLVDLLRRLVADGHSVVAVEHQPLFIAQADWIIDLGPEAGDAGGQIVTTGSVADVMKHSESLTAAALRALCGDTSSR